MKVIKYLILIPILVGLAAAGVLALQSLPDQSPKLSGYGAKVFVGASLVLVALAIPWRRSRAGRREHSPARVTAARMVFANFGHGSRPAGEIKVRASHSSQVTKEIGLPPGSRIETIHRGEEYRVLIPNTDRIQLEAIAREHGFKGQIKEGG